MDGRADFVLLGLRLGGAGIVHLVMRIHHLNWNWVL